MRDSTWWVGGWVGSGGGGWMVMAGSINFTTHRTGIVGVGGLG